MDTIRILEQSSDGRQYKLEILSDSGRALEHLQRLRVDLSETFANLARVERADEKKVVCWVWVHMVPMIPLDKRDYLAAELLKAHRVQGNALAVQYGSTIEDFFEDEDSDF